MVWFMHMTKFFNTYFRKREHYITLRMDGIDLKCINLSGRKCKLDKEL